MTAPASRVIAFAIFERLRPVEYPLDSPAYSGSCLSFRGPDRLKRLENECSIYVRNCV
jgi:hypothetical protein